MGEIIVLRVLGEVDLVTVSVLATTLDNRIGRQPAHLVVDLAHLQFCSAWGISVLFSAGATATERGFGYAISSLSPHLDRIWEKLWPDEMPVRYRDAATAVNTIRARQAQALRRHTALGDGLSLLP